jgi:hypothetical protein
LIATNGRKNFSWRTSHPKYVSGTFDQFLEENFMRPYLENLRMRLAIAGLSALSWVCAPSFAAVAPVGGGLFPYVTVANTDVKLFGLGGLRGASNTSGTINVSGIVNTTPGLVTRAILVWHGPTGQASTANGALTLDGQTITGTLVGVSDDNQWSELGYSESRAWAADVTDQVAAKGNGAYQLTNAVNNANAAMNGVSLIVFYDDGNASNNQDVVLFLGNDSNFNNVFDADGWNATLSGINYTSGAASLTMIVSDGQSGSGFDDEGFSLNGTVIRSPGINFSGASVPVRAGSVVTNGGLWDHVTYDVTAVMSPTVHTLTLTSAPVVGARDALSLVGAMFILPAGSVQPPLTAQTAVGVPAMGDSALAALMLGTLVLGAVVLRRRSAVAK